MTAAKRYNGYAMTTTTKPKIGSSVVELIGNTPMVRLHHLVDSKMAAVLAKSEAGNPGGSVKDRICMAMIEDAETRGLLKPGSTVVEATSGNKIGRASCRERVYVLV